MTKAIIIQGCKDCPYLIHEKIHLMNEFKTTALLCSKYGIDLQACDLDTPHPNCKLNDLPDIADINYFASSVSPVVKKARVEGANWVIEQICK